MRSFFPGWKSQLLGDIGLRCEGQGLKEMYKAGFFTQRVVGAWNSLPGEVVEADMIMTFKENLDKYTNRNIIPGRVRGFSSVRQHGRCRLGGPKGLFLCGNFLCSLLFIKVTGKAPRHTHI